MSQESAGFQCAFSHWSSSGAKKLSISHKLAPSLQQPHIDWNLLETAGHQDEALKCFKLWKQIPFPIWMIYFTVFTAFDFCEWPCACPVPSECQQQWDSWDRSNWSCLGNGGSRYASSHWTLSCGRSCGKCCRFDLGPFSQCTFWSPLGFADRETPLKYPCQLFAQQLFCWLDSYNLLFLCCVMCLSNAILVPTFVPQTAQE